MRCVAFLRAINVADRRVKMDRLRDVVAETGVRDITTFLASGNVLFSIDVPPDAALEQRFSQVLAAGLGYPVDTFIRSGEEVAAIVASPLQTDGAFEGSTLEIGFLPDAPAPEVTEALVALSTPPECLHVAGRELWWHREPMSRTRMSGARVERTLGTRTTWRGAGMLRRLADGPLSS